MADICEYSKVCKHYRKDAFTCNEKSNTPERIYYCGAYKTHLKFQISSEFDQMYQALDFVNKSKLAGKWWWSANAEENTKTMLHTLSVLAAIMW